MDVPHMTEAVKLGAFIEFVGGSLAAKDAASRLTRFTEAIRSLGVESCILSSDLGQAGNALPADGFGEFLAALRAKGFSEQEIDRMSKENPARLIGLP
jgi:predicted metal-dependent phosphotriesterase family hydrolase